MAPQVDFQVSGVQAGTADVLRADSLRVNLSTGFIYEISAGISVPYTQATYKNAGVEIDVEPDAGGGNLLVVSVAQDVLTSQFGFRAKVASAKLTNSDPPVTVPLKNITLNHHRVEHQPRLPRSHRTKTVTAVSDIGFLITGFGLRVLPAGRIPVGWDFMPSILGTFADLKQTSLDSALSWLGNAIGQPLDFLGTIANLATFGQIRIEEVTPFVNTLPVRIKFEPAWSYDQTIAFKVIGGIDGAGVRLRFSYPCPTLDNWGRRCDEKEEPWTDIPRLELELGLAVTLQVDTAAKRITIHNITPFLPFNAPEEMKAVFGQLQGVALQIFAEIYGAGWVKGAVTGVINSALPIKLPAQWDVSRLSLSRETIIVDGEEVWGVQLGLRYEEHLFD
jgi:hypothetical protein